MQLYIFAVQMERNKKKLPYAYSALPPSLSLHYSSSFQVVSESDTQHESETENIENFHCEAVCCIPNGWLKIVLKITYLSTNQKPLKVWLFMQIIIENYFLFCSHTNRIISCWTNGWEITELIWNVEH